jgi:hypothetical protein
MSAVRRNVLTTARPDRLTAELERSTLNIIDTAGIQGRSDAVAGSQFAFGTVVLRRSQKQLSLASCPLIDLSGVNVARLFGPTLRRERLTAIASVGDVRDPRSCDRPLTPPYEPVSSSRDEVTLNRDRCA